MILSDTSILAAIKRGEIVIDPFDEKRLGSNSYDVCLGKTLAVYASQVHISNTEKCNSDFVLQLPSPNTEMWDLDPHTICTKQDGVALDAKAENETFEFAIPPEGYELRPGVLYLGVTAEYTETHAHVPFLEGKSSIGRLGIDIHATAGKGDVGFCGFWTLEISVVHPVRVYAGMRIGQLIYFDVDGEITNPYNRKASAKYNNRIAKPQGSKMFLNFQND